MYMLIVDKLVHVCHTVFSPRSEDANKSFSAAVQLHDSLVKAWALWGDYLDQLFAKDRLARLDKASHLTAFPA